MNHLTLAEHAKRLGDKSLSELAESRLESSTFSVADWKINIARQKIDLFADQALLQFGKSKNLEGSIESLFNGGIVNLSENRPALHWALRCSNPSFQASHIVKESLNAPFAFAEAIRAATIKSASGRKFQSIVHIGIGGSDLGPRLLYDAFYKERDRQFELRFCANLDPLDFALAVDGLDPNTTLVIGVSKSFQTEETLYNLQRAREWLEVSLNDAWIKNMAIVTANQMLAAKWLNSSDGTIFTIPDNVGGRYSIWSAGSVSCFIALGTDLISDILTGAETTDKHVKTEPIQTNVAMRLALLDYWNASVLSFPMRIELAYTRRLRQLPAYLQQLEMESNGKSVKTDGTKVKVQTTPAVWGGEGSLGQHSYHQWLHQGTQIAPSEFIIATEKEEDDDGQARLVANALAQAEVLAEGRSLGKIEPSNGSKSIEISKQKALSGGRPSTVIMTNQFSPRNFGSLLSLFEHRTFLSGQLWSLNSFDQWGVEQGKQLAQSIRPIVKGASASDNKITQNLVTIWGLFS